MKKLIVFLYIFTGIAAAQDLTQQWQSIDSLIKAGDFTRASTMFPSFLDELKKSGLNDKLVAGYYHYGNTLIQTGEYLRADYAYNKAKEKAKEAGLDQNYAELTRIQITSLYNAVRSNPAMPASTVNTLLSNCFNYANETGDLQLIKSVQLLRIETERKNERYNSALSLVQQLIGKLKEGKPDDPDISKLNVLSAELSLKAGKTSATSVEELSPEQSVQLLIFAAVDAEKTGNLLKAYNTLSSIKPDQYRALKWDVISEISKKRMELADKLDKTEEIIISLSEIRNDQINDSTELNIGMLELLKLIIIGNLQLGYVQKSYDEITFIEKALADKRVTPDFYPHFFRMRGDISYLQGDFDDAITYYERAEESPGSLSQREFYSLLNNLGLSYYKNNRRSESIKAFDKLIASAAEQQFIRFAVQADLNAGIVFMRDELMADALARFKRAQETAQKNNLLELNLLAGIRMAEVYYNQGFNDFASEKFREVKTFVTQVKDPQEKINILASIGNYERSRDNSEQAIIYLSQAYKLATQFNLTNLKLYLAGELGDTYLLAGNAKEAKNLYNSFLPLVRNSGDTSELIKLNIKLSKCHYVLREYDLASQILKNNLSILRETEEDYLTVKGNNLKDIYLYTLSLTELASNNYSSGLLKNDTRLIFLAYREAAKAAELSNDYFVTQLIGSKDDDNSLRYLETYRLLVDIAVTLYLQTGDSKYLDKSFETSEQSRSRNFITEVGSSLIEKLNDKELQQVTTFSRQLSSGAQTSSRDLLTVNGSSAAGAGQVRGIKVIKDTTKSILKLQNKYDDILKELKKNKHKASELVSISTLTLPAVQQIISPDQVILNYFVSKESIYLYCIEKDTIILAMIEIAEDTLRDNIQEVRKHLQNPLDKEHLRISELLYSKLISPVDKRIKDKKLIIIPSGQLNNLPFGALNNNGRFLVEDHILTVLPNLSSLQLLRQKPPVTVSSPMIAIGNPINDYTSPLPGAESEVKAIQAIFKNNNSFLRENAQETSVKKEISKGEIVHIACHGLFNYDYPLLSCLALAGNNQDDGRLELHEIYNLNMNRTSLVVLSACETALSQIKDNDDMIGLVRGFLYTGASSVIASLWKVDDAGTYELMVKFYTYLSQGNSKGVALQKAQTDMIRSPNFSHPFYWSAFVLNGME
ncbi:MAG: CHAT domain-containing protein [Ignavibacteriaceae bacterium]|nr:CHAT domain-containing protein [Ignavibacteriaceae bacterium]